MARPDFEPLLETNAQFGRGRADKGAVPYATAVRPPSRRWASILAVLALANVAIASGSLIFQKKWLNADVWDPRVTDLVAFVENERGLRFKHPVRIDFLSTDDFREEATAHEELDTEDRAQIESTEAMLRALGLAGGDLDLESAGDELAGDGVVGLYNPGTQRISVRGQTLDNERRITLVHELTHALQDQQFAIGDVEPETSGAQAAFTAVVEADAEAVAEAWRETLSDDDIEALDAAEEATSEDADFKGVPDVFIELMGFPYVLGPSFLDAVVAARGEKGRNQLLRRPPTSEEHILVPQTYLSGQKAQGVATPRLQAGEKLIKDSQGDFGMLSLLVVLGEQLDFSVAWPAVQGWKGDALVGFVRDGRTCARVSVLFDEAAQAEKFESAFTRWAEGLERAGVQRKADSVLVESCDPGPGRSRTRTEGHVSGIQGLELRQYLGGTFERFGARPLTATCVADGLISRLGANRIAELDVAMGEDPDHPETERVQALTAELTRDCPK